MNDSDQQPPEPNVYTSPEAEDYINPLAADNPLHAQRGIGLGLVLWVAWLMVVLTAIVWFVR